jgi:hypothetical protein
MEALFPGCGFSDLWQGGRGGAAIVGKGTRISSISFVDAVNDCISDRFMQAYPRCAIEAGSMSMLSRVSSFAARAFLWLIGGAFVLGFLYLPLALLRGLLISTGCFTEVLAEVRGVSGFDFEVSETDCWHSPAVSVYVLKPGRTKKTRLFQYTRLRNTDPPAVITSTGEHAVLISLSRARTLDCRRDTWKELTVRYDVGSVKHTGIDARPPEC